MTMVLEPVCLSIVDGEQPDANGVELGLVAGEFADRIDVVAHRVYEWMAENGVGPDNPDRWVLLTPAGEYVGQLRNLHASMYCHMMRPVMVPGPDGQPAYLRDLPLPDQEEWAERMTAAARDAMNIAGHLRARVLAQLVIRDGLEATASRHGLTSASLRAVLLAHGWGMKKIRAELGEPATG